MSAETPTVDDYDADTITFGDCECDEPVPDPEHLELPDRTAVRILACAECGDAIDWDVGGRAEDELRELIRDKQDRIRALEQQLKEQEPDPLEERETRLITPYDPEAEEEINRLETEVDRLQNQIEMLDHAKHELDNERQELRDEVNRLEDELAEARTPTPLWKRVGSVLINRRTVNLAVGFGISGLVAWLMWPISQRAAESFESSADTIGEPIVEMDPMFLIISVLVVFLASVAIHIGPRGVGGR